MAGDPFARLVSLACHDLRTPLATVGGFAKTLTRTGDLPEREQRFVEMMDEAAGQMTELLEVLSLAARIESGRYEPALGSEDTLALARSADERIEASGRGEVVETDGPVVRRALEALAVAAIRHGRLTGVRWKVEGRTLTLTPVGADAAPVVTGEEPKDLGALVARTAVERLGGSIELVDATLVVKI